jgi:hypothetical protein
MRFISLNNFFFVILHPKKISSKYNQINGMLNYLKSIL